MKKLAYLAAMLLPAGSAFAEGEAVVETANTSVFNVGALPIIIVLVIALIIAFAVVSSLKAQLKTARNKTEASDYVRDDSFKLHERRDYFLYRTVERRKIETNNK